jgi:hypothetical protein
MPTPSLRLLSVSLSINVYAGAAPLQPPVENVPSLGSRGNITLCDSYRFEEDLATIVSLDQPCSVNYHNSSWRKVPFEASGELILCGTETQYNGGEVLRILEHAPCPIQKPIFPWQGYFTGSYDLDPAVVLENVKRTPCDIYFIGENVAFKTLQVFRLYDL